MRDAEGRVVCQGTFVDVGETLLTWEGLNEAVYHYMKKKKQEGKRVVIFTSVDDFDTIRTTREILQKIGLDIREFPVVFKRDFRDCLLEEVIDNEPPEGQGFKAITYRRPNDPYITSFYEKFISTNPEKRLKSKQQLNPKNLTKEK